ncbi:hypothetical protein B0H16DRAFT_775760 [Mycena metata]|uniref:Uncharacterized protein n=1 Tax=Mycena metata TaxID=1033252 RepID=A0AAD7NAZ1_9AGAR|nr:hypothetical protein B0H16DRAFT_775760 [Mycena metata]
MIFKRQATDGDLSSQLEAGWTRSILCESLRGPSSDRVDRRRHSPSTTGCIRSSRLPSKETLSLSLGMAFVQMPLWTIRGTTSCRPDTRRPPATSDPTQSSPYYIRTFPRRATTRLPSALDPCEPPPSSPNHTTHAAAATAAPALSTHAPLTSRAQMRHPHGRLFSFHPRARVRVRKRLCHRHDQPYPLRKSRLLRLVPDLLVCASFRCFVSTASQLRV